MHMNIRLRSCLALKTEYVCVLSSSFFRQQYSKNIKNNTKRMKKIQRHLHEVINFKDIDFKYLKRMRKFQQFRAHHTFIYLILC